MPMPEHDDSLHLSASRTSNPTSGFPKMNIRFSPLRISTATLPFALLCIVLASSFVLAGQPIIPVAVSDQRPPGIGPNTGFTTFRGASSLNNGGEVVFQASLIGVGINSGNNEAIFVGKPGALALLAREGSPAPGSPQQAYRGGFKAYGLNELGQVFFASPTGSDLALALFLGTPGAVASLAKQGDHVSGAPGAIDSVFTIGFHSGGIPINDDGRAGFGAYFEGHVGVSILVGTPGALKITVSDGDPAPGVGGGARLSQIQTYSDLATLASEDRILFGAQVISSTRPERNGLFVGKPGSLELLALEGDPAPGTAAGVFYDYLETMRLSESGIAAFGGFVRGLGVRQTNSNALWLGTPGDVRLVARGDMQAPGCEDGVKYGVTPQFNVALGFGPSINSVGEIVFDQYLSTGQQGIWAGTPGNLRLVARQGQRAPGLATSESFGGAGNSNGTTFGQGFRRINDAGRVAFTARIGTRDSNFDRAVFVSNSDGELVYVTRYGDSVDVGGGRTLRIEGVYLDVEGFNSKGQLLIHASLSDGSEGLFIAETAQPVVTSPAAVTARAGVPFTYQLTATNRPTSYTAANLPPGLNLDSALGVITGTPSEAGTKQVTIGATNASGATTATLTITIEPARATGPVITNATAVTARAGRPFRYQVRVSGVTSAATITATELPSGLTINAATGVISGTVEQPGSYAFLLKVADGSASARATLQLTFTPNPALPVITSGTAANLQTGQSFDYRITAPSTADPNDPTTYSISGTLPEGLVFDPSTGTISGTYNGAAAQKSDGSSASAEALTSPTSSFLSGIQLFAHNSHGTATTSLSFLIGKATSAVNISTRMAVGREENVLIAGFIVTGNAPKKVLIRGIGPSLSSGGTGVVGRLQDTVLALHGSDGSLIVSNDDWRSAQQQAIIDTTIPPNDNRESAIVATLQPANYTAILRGKNDSTGIGLVEVYDLDAPASSQLVQISTRGFVQTNDDVMIGGFILSGTNPANVLVRAIGPTLANAGVNGALQDTTLELVNGNGDTLGANDNWRSDQEQAIRDTTVPPADDRESAIVSNLAAGNYTAIVRGKDNSTGVALVEVFVLQ